MEETILGFFKNYGLNLTLLALSGIALLGLLKWFGCFKKVSSKAKKYVYFGVSAGISIMACTIYILLFSQFEIISYLLLCGAVMIFTLATYGIYENTGLRSAWKKLILDNISRLVGFIVATIKEKKAKSVDIKALVKEFGKDTLKLAADTIKASKEAEVVVEEPQAVIENTNAV